MGQSWTMLGYNVGQFEYSVRQFDIVLDIALDILKMFLDIKNVHHYTCGLDK